MTFSMAERRALARAMSAVENGAPEAADLLDRAYGSPCMADVVGVTGPPGAGKSTLIDRLVVRWTQADRRVAILACDPSSPWSSGALLGDRVRMRAVAAAPEVFLRSLSQRDAPGGVAAVTADCCALARAAGFDTIVLETIGAGQSEIGVCNVADCVVAVSVPGLGDGLQAEKAGLLEVADLHAVNKCDLAGAAMHARQIVAVLDVVYPGGDGARESRQRHGSGASPAALPGVAALRARHGDPARDVVTWRPPVLLVSATTGDGIGALAHAVEVFLDWQRTDGRLEVRRTKQTAQLLLDRLAGALTERLSRASGVDLVALADDASRAVSGGALAPHQALETICDALAGAMPAPARAASKQGGR
jgi:LAO/AO transport system kinase